MLVRFMARDCFVVPISIGTPRNDGHAIMIRESLKVSKGI
jgi:hypothetical protein